MLRSLECIRITQHLRMPLTSSHCTSEAFTAGSSSSCLLSPKTPHPSHLTSAKVKGKCPRCPIGSTPRERLVTAAVAAAVTVICEKPLPSPRLFSQGNQRRNIRWASLSSSGRLMASPYSAGSRSRAIVHTIHPTAHSRRSKPKIRKTLLSHSYLHLYVPARRGNYRLRVRNQS